MAANQQLAVRAHPQERLSTPVQGRTQQKAPIHQPPVAGPIQAGSLDPQAILSLQATAGNAAVSSLIASLGAGPAVQRAPAAAPTAPPAAGPASEDRRAQLDRLHTDSRAAAKDIKEILLGNTYLGSKNQAQIMAIVHQWAEIPAPAGSTMSGMDWLIAGLRQNTYEVGMVVKQTTSAFDELHRRMSSDNVADFQKLVEQSGRQFKNEKPIELAKFEVSQEDIIRGLKAGGELAAAVASGGGSILWQIISWLANTLPGLWNTVKSVLGVIDSIKAFKAGGVGSRFNPAAFGTLAISALFGELQGLPIVGGGEPPKAEESEGEASGLSKVLMMIVRGITVVKNAYNKVAGKVNSILGSINISGKEWFGKAAMVYAGITTLLEKIENPGAALKTLADNLQQQIGGFFGKIKDHIGEVVGDVKTKLELVTQPAQLLGLVADKLVSTVLNFIITHPPSELVRTVFQVIQTASGKELIQIVREQLKPIGDDIIKKIADSHVVQAAISPLKGPVHMIADAIGRVTEKGLGVVNDVKEKIAGYLSGDQLRELAGLGPEAAQTSMPAVAEAAAAQPADFLGVVKQGLHSHLMTIGMAKLIESGKALAKKGWEKAKGAAKAAYAGIKGAIVGRKQGFEVAGEHHELWTEQSDDGFTLMMASKTTPLEEKLDEYRAAVKQENAKENELKELEFQITKLKDKKKATAGARAEAATAAGELEAIQKTVAGLVQQLEGLLVKGKLKDEYHEDSRGRPILAADMLKRAPGTRDMAAEARVSRPLTQLFEYFQDQGGTWQGTGYSKDRPTFDAAHLIPHDFGGRPGVENLVPVEARVNKSFMGTDEGNIRKDLTNGKSLYSIVRCVYKDPPNELARKYRVPGRSTKNFDSDLAEGTLVRFNLVALERVPDEVSVKVIDVKDNSTAYEMSYPTGGPVIDWVKTTRGDLDDAGDPRGEQILDPDARQKAIAKGKAATDWEK